MKKILNTAAQPAIKSLVCQLVGAAVTNTVKLPSSLAMDDLQRLIKKKFRSKVKASDLKLFSAVKNDGKWMATQDEISRSLIKKNLLKREIGPYDDILGVFAHAPRDGVLHVVAVECPVHPQRSARWEELNSMLGRLWPTWAIIPRSEGGQPPGGWWQDIFTSLYGPQMQRHTEDIVAVPTEIVDEVERKLAGPLPDPSDELGVLLDGVRVQYHTRADITVHYEDRAFCVVEPNCENVEQAIAQVLAGCGAVADRTDSNEVFGVVVTKDGKWIILRCLDDKILVDDGEENQVIVDDAGNPDRKSLAVLLGKLYGIVTSRVPPPPPGWSRDD